MIFPPFAPHALGNLVMQAATQREPDFVVGGAERPYLRRWFLTPRDDGPGVYLHHFLRSDDDRALHDHPYESTSIILTGQYIEHLADGRGYLRQAGWTGSRSATEAHRVELLQDEAGNPLPVWTLFLHGPRVRDWGFHCPQGWVPWQQFVDARDHGAVGRGCG